MEVTHLIDGKNKSIQVMYNPTTTVISLQQDGKRRTHSQAVRYNRDQCSNQRQIVNQFLQFFSILLCFIFFKNPIWLVDDQT